MNRAEKHFRLVYSRLVRQAGWSLFSILFFCYLRAVALTFAPGNLADPEQLYSHQPDPVDIQSVDSSETSNGLGALQIKPDSVCPGSFYRRQTSSANPAASPSQMAQFIYSLTLDRIACLHRTEIFCYTNLLMKVCIPVRAGPAAAYSKV